MLLLFILIVFCLFIILVILWFVKYYKYEKFLKHVPGPTPIPLLGNALEFTNTTELLSTSLKLCRKYGNIMKVRLGFNNPALVLTDAKAIEYVLGSTEILKKGFNYKFLHNWLGKGLLTSEGNKWKKHRKMLTPAFHFSILEQFVPIFNSFSKILIDILETEVAKDSFDIYPYISLFSLDIICATSMGTNVNAQLRSDSQYIQNVKEICRMIVIKVLSPIKSLDFLYSLTNDYVKEEALINNLHDYTNSVIASRKAELAKKAKTPTEIDDMGIKRKLTFLDLMLQYKMEKNDITDDEIRQEVDTFTFEGHDTTTSGISFTLYCLATHSDVQNRVFEELETIFSDDWERNTSYKDLQNMKYLEMVIKESLRLYPPVPSYARYLQSEIKYDGITIPEGTILSIFAFGMHRCPVTYPDPDRFDPERFTPEEQSKRSPYAYIPFSAGPRNCIGQKFAMLEMKFVISAILRSFELLPAIPHHTLMLTPEVILKSTNGICIRIKKRKLNVT